MNRKKALKQLEEAAIAVFGDKSSDKDIEAFKRKINYQTMIGSMAESGGHIHGHMDPMCDYDVVSVICALRSFSSFDSPVDELETKKETYYKERW